jgi:DNA-binding PadR family transcriptional regulator
MKQNLPPWVSFLNYLLLSAYDVFSCQQFSSCAYVYRKIYFARCFTIITYDMENNMRKDNRTNRPDRDRRGRHGFHHGRHGLMRGRGEGEFPRGRRLDSNDLQLIVLAFLAQQPAHGYELIKTVEEHSGGFYIPSPGVIYPALTYLSEIGYAGVEQEGARKLYNITPEGKSYLASNRAAADTLLDTLSRIASRMDEVRDAFAGVGEFDSEASDEIRQARLGLREAIRRKRGCDPKEARRIVEILNRATTDILSK